MSEKTNLDVDTSEAERKIDNLDAKIEDTEEKLVEMSKEVERETEKSFNEVMGMMQASYMMVSGFAQLAGGNLSQIFASMFTIAISAIGTYQAIAVASAAVPGGQLQAIMMSVSLATAIGNLVVLSLGQEELSRRISGLNMSLQGISSMIRSFYFT